MADEQVASAERPNKEMRMEIIGWLAKGALSVEGVNPNMPVGSKDDRDVDGDRKPALQVLMDYIRKGLEHIDEYGPE